jgi:ATP-dependent protease HslVU (ClpYQ) peptidase subunit
MNIFPKPSLASFGNSQGKLSTDMTTIAAIQGDGWAVIAGDSQSSDGDGFAINIPTGKIFKNNELIIAGAGQVRGINLLEHGWEAPAVKLKNIDKYVTSILVPSIRKCFSMADYEYKRDGESVENDNIFIICIQHQIYRIESDYSWERSADNIYVAGSGERFALGALEALNAGSVETVTQAKNHLRKAIKIASKYDAYSGGDIKFVVSQ